MPNCRPSWCRWLPRAGMPEGKAVALACRLPVTVSRSLACLSRGVRRRHSHATPAHAPAVVQRHQRVPSSAASAQRQSVASSQRVLAASKVAPSGLTPEVLQPQRHQRLRRVQDGRLADVAPARSCAKGARVQRREQRAQHVATTALPARPNVFHVLKPIGGVAPSPLSSAGALLMLSAASAASSSD
jgi:hypothetical protein